MENDNFSTQLIISKLLPFMNEKFFWDFLAKENVSYKDVKVVYTDGLPVYALVVFRSQEGKKKFFSNYQGKKYTSLNYQVTVEKSWQVTELESLVQAMTISEAEKITFPVAYHRMSKDDYDRTLKEPGLIYLDKEVMGHQEKVIGYIIKKIGSNLLSGKSIMDISLPVQIFDKRTLLQVLAYEMSLAPIFLTRSFYSETILEKLKWSTVFLVSQLNLSPLQTKPFSPILGETFQCRIGDLSIYIEQTRHKPLTNNFYMVYKNSDRWLFKIYGSMTTDASTGANTVKAKKYGKFLIEFQDGIIHEIIFPKILISGTTMGTRLFNFTNTALVIDRKNNLASLLNFNPDEKGAFASFFSKKQKSFPDTIKGDIVYFSDLKIDEKFIVTKKKESSLCSITGEWSDNLYFNEERYWWVMDYQPVTISQMRYKLPSDSSNREDLNFLLSGDISCAQAAKESLEEKQRNDRKLRENYSKNK